MQTTACPPNYKFTGYERDSETGLDYAFARFYSSRLGRFLSTDPLGGSIGNLQSHNAYAYTGNNPLNRVDPFGMSDCPDLKIGCMPSNECLDGLCLAGAPGVDLFGGRWADFWGGDAAIENGMFLRALGLISNFDILALALDPCIIELLGDCHQPPNMDYLALLNWGDYAGRTGNSGGGVGGPCKGVTPYQLDYSKAGGMQHIIDDHINTTDSNKSRYVYAEDPATLTTDIKFGLVFAFNMYTFSNGAWSKQKNGNIAMVAQIPANKPFYNPADKMLWYTPGNIGQVGAAHGGGATDLNTLILAPDCKTVVTAHPGIPAWAQ